MIYEKIGLAAMLEMTAEEAIELSHACLKLARIERGENPTPADKFKVMDGVEEEAADLMICIDELSSTGLIVYARMHERMNAKLDRARERLCTSK